MQGESRTYRSVATKRIKVNNVAPTLTLGGDYTATAGQALSVADLGVFTDPGLDCQDGISSSPETYTYTINWGDGESSSGTVTGDEGGQSGVQPIGRVGGSHTYTTSQVCSASVIVTDSHEPAVCRASR